MAKSSPRRSFEKALAAVERAASRGKCSAARAARRRALRGIERLEALGGREAGKDARKALAGVRRGACRLLPLVR